MAKRQTVDFEIKEVTLVQDEKKHIRSSFKVLKGRLKEFEFLANNVSYEPSDVNNPNGGLSYEFVLLGEKSRELYDKHKKLAEKTMGNIIIEIVLQKMNRQVNTIANA